MRIVFNGIVKDSYYGTAPAALMAAYRSWEHALCPFTNAAAKGTLKLPEPGVEFA